jgi:NAD(P)-dependent dehydrogenase (short-subunit alcohol dehydrogenase family)
MTRCRHHTPARPLPSGSRASPRHASRGRDRQRRRHRPGGVQSAGGAWLPLRAARCQRLVCSRTHARSAAASGCWLHRGRRGPDAVARAARRQLPRVRVRHPRPDAGGGEGRRRGGGRQRGGVRERRAEARHLRAARAQGAAGLAGLLFRGHQGGLAGQQRGVPGACLPRSPCSRAALLVHRRRRARRRRAAARCAPRPTPRAPTQHAPASTPVCAPHATRARSRARPFTHSTRVRARSFRFPLLPCACAQIVAPMAEISLADWTNVMSTNLTAPFMITKLLLPELQVRLVHARMRASVAVVGETLSTATLTRAARRALLCQAAQGAVVMVSSIHANLTKPGARLCVLPLLFSTLASLSHRNVSHAAFAANRLAARPPAAGFAACVPATTRHPRRCAARARSRLACTDAHRIAFLFRSRSLLCSYATSKGGLVTLAKALAVELGPLGIRVNAVRHTCAGALALVLRVPHALSPRRCCPPRPTRPCCAPASRATPQVRRRRGMHTMQSHAPSP